MRLSCVAWIELSINSATASGTPKSGKKKIENDEQKKKKKEENLRSGFGQIL
jgi:hypothetical protein